MKKQKYIKETSYFQCNIKYQMNNMKIFAKETIVLLYLYLFKLTLELNGHGASKKVF